MRVKHFYEAHKCPEKARLKLEISDEQGKTRVILELFVSPWHWNELDTSVTATCSPDSTERKQKFGTSQTHSICLNNLGC